MAESWTDVFEELPPDDSTVWVRSSFGCLPPVQMIYMAAATDWLFDLPSSVSIYVPFWAYRYWRAV